MNGNEYLILDIHSLQDILLAKKKEVHDLEQTKNSLLVSIKEAPNKVIVDLDAEIASRTKQRDALNAEISVQKDVLIQSQKTGNTMSQSLSAVTKQHQENAKNALLRLTTAEKSLQGVKQEREAHDRATALAKAAREKAGEEAAKEEQRVIRCQLETKAAMEERDLMLRETEEIRVYLERYRADKLNLEKWEEKLNNRELFLEEVAHQLGVTEVNI
jgi:hypothetical protein